MTQGDGQGLVGAGGRSGTGLRCSDEARRRDDPLFGTASRTAGWLLIEEPGGWGPDALLESAIDPEVARALADRTREAGVRVQLIRRPRQRRDRAGKRTVALVHSAASGGTVWWHTVRTDRELLDVPLDVPSGVRTGGASGRPEPIYLVCTHGTRDVCCAVRGRPVADHLASHRPDQTWETSHVGGHRYAANLVLLPHGLYYGHVTPDEALQAVKAYEAGLVVPNRLRGRSIHPSQVQAAECFARLELAATRLDELTPGNPVAVDPDTWEVPFGRNAGTVTVTVRAVSGVPTRLSCRDTEPSPYTCYELVALTTD
jgi:hypothetical protein